MKITSIRRTILATIAGLLGACPGLAAALCSGLVVVAVLVGACVFLVQMKVQEVEAGHDKVLEQMQALQGGVGNLLTELNTAYRADCAPDNLNLLRGLLFEHPHARDIGILDKKRHLLCNTSLGWLSSPIPPGNGEVNGPIGRYIFHAPVPLASGVARALAVERGRFQVVMDESLVHDAFRLYADRVWVGQGEPHQRVYESRRGKGMDAMPMQDTLPLRIDWANLNVIVTSGVPGVIPVAMQSVLRPSDLYRNAGILPICVLGMCLLLGALTHKQVARYCQYLQSMDHRIRYLCTPANIVCHYQPILELATGRVVGCEVLTRLRDGDKLVYPDQFIPALARSHLTWAFDAAASNCALTELAGILPAHSDFSVAINFFPHNLKRDSIHAHLQAALARSKRTNIQIDLEVTEHDFRPEILPELHALKNDGYAISIDDFGTGYSNLGMVKRVAPDYLKIDRSFVAEMGDTTLRASLVPEIVAIANAVGSKVVAEGIESSAQVLRLKALGVQFGQGYYFAKPMPLQHLERYLQIPQEQTARLVLAACA